jgi:tetratricopeptide (TPR) repeat protein
MLQIKNHDKLFSRASQLAREGEYKKAIELHNTLIESDPKNTLYKIHLGVAHFDAGDYSNVIKITSDYIKLEPRAPFVHQLRGRAFFNIEDFETYMGDTCFEISKAIYPLVYRKNGQYGLLTFEKTSRTFGSYVIENLRIKRIHYSINNVIVHPASYEKISFLRRIDERENFYYGEDLIITSKNGKYGILNLHNNI